jgi:2-polyprenyl-3-methyl-5-hydroxy-6-metoxy-1,4-benzoquinol methylase
MTFRSTIRDTEDNPAQYYSSSRVRAGHLDVVRCTGCGLLMTNPRDDDATLAHVYGAICEEEYDREETSRVQTARTFLQLVQTHRGAKGALLDIGCAVGLFAAVATESGWNVTGIDASSWAVGRARRRCASATFLHGRVEDANFPPASFDVVTMWDVLEHVTSPADTLAQVRQWLTQDGWLFLNLPDAGSLIARCAGRRWMLLLREHLWYFDATCLSRLLGQCGFEILERRPNRVTFSMRNVLRRLGQYEGSFGRPSRLLAKAPMMERIVAHFPIGEMLVVARPVARKS